MDQPTDTPSTPMQRLLEVMARLRDPDGGCPWDIEQDFASIAPYTIEEAYEVADAIAQGDLGHLRAELGDLLLQVVFHAQMAAEQDAFDFADVAGDIADKMVKRHPHVFGGADIATAEAQTLAWEDQKAAERAAEAARHGRPESALDGIALALPALSRALKLQRRAARVGFDWPSAAPVLDKVREEIDELRQEITADDHVAMADELGDLLFSLVNLARHHQIDPEGALRAANEKFERRFRGVERRLEEAGKTAKAVNLDELETFWRQAKAEDGKAPR
ncbi:MAG: nucleoside triphosphate pyrophosphohydrolase [Alphaproteobacteria bacterium]|jgi:MazG family protein|nr:nucleoside triphosphate pyrophosphohydrolase [Alphaproteobacteria bacterium]MDP6566000.1 nucleoside triphosphate pyrophosphohydrolase [Alphaproteobacteria bacterium]MDP6815787.1 nucleoside triphosphate pyrophosphohydrolase [Alphaproteobacteria bacterium]